MEPTKTETLTLNFTTVSAVHPLDNETLEITMKDLEAEKGDGILDERWVYERPGIAFASSGRLAAAKTQYGDDKVVEMKRTGSASQYRFSYGRLEVLQCMGIP